MTLITHGHRQWPDKGLGWGGERRVHGTNGRKGGYL